jgi:hypothetical protein
MLNGHPPEGCGNSLKARKLRKRLKVVVELVRNSNGFTEKRMVVER